MAKIRIKNNNGTIEDYNKKQIINSLINDAKFIKEKFNISDSITEDIARSIANKITRTLNKMDLKNEQIISSDTIRGLVSSELIEKELFDIVNVTELVGLRVHDIYNINMGEEDKDNANLNSNPETAAKITSDTVMKKYYLRMMDKKISHAHISGLIHIHDLEYFGLRPFCRSWDLRRFFLDGFSPDGEDNGITAHAPKHAEVAILQACKILAMGQCNHAGGQGLLYGTVFLAPYMREKTYQEIKQLIQMMLFELNQMYISRGGQVIFSSININPGCPKVLEDVPVVYAGKIYNGQNETELWTYKELEREIRLQFQALMELSLEGDATGKLFPFPKLEVAIEKKFIDENTWNNNQLISDNDELIIVPSYKELYEMAFVVTAKTGILYFDNLLPEKKNAEEGVGCTQCCSYSFATDENEDNNFAKRLNFEDGYYFNNLGGMQACSINLPRLAYQSKKDIKLLMAYIFNTMDLIVDVFKTKKEFIENNIHRLKYITQKGKNTIELTDINALVYEIGIVGLNEMLQYFTGYQIHENEEAITIGKHVLFEMKQYCDILSEMHKMKIVLARTPAETVAMKFAICDIQDDNYKEMAMSTIKGDIKAALKLNESGIKNLPIYYSNGFAPYVGADISIIKRLRFENEFWDYVNGGAISHIWLGEQNPDPIGLMSFAMKIFKNTNIGYLAFTKDLSQCIDCKNIMGGLVTKCDKCNGKNINWRSRITGYLSEVAQVRDGKISNSRWNAAKNQELYDRVKLNLNNNEVL